MRDQVGGSGWERDEAARDVDPPVACPALQVVTEQIRQRVQDLGRGRRMQAVTAVVDPLSADLEARCEPADMVGALEHDHRPTARGQPPRRGQPRRAGPQDNDVGAHAAPTSGMPPPEDCASLVS